jgi:hypothetical protein
MSIEMETRQQRKEKNRLSKLEYDDDK